MFSNPIYISIPPFQFLELAYRIFVEPTFNNFSWNATNNCMKTCVERLSPRPDLLLVDAVDTTFCVPHESIIKGDAKSYLVGAASIIAKVYRDRLMDEYDALYPAYNFKKNKGYGTKEHIDAIREVGPCPIHRKTFIKNFWDEEANAPRKSS